MRPAAKTLVKAVSSGFYAGYAPFAPGTVASLWGVVIFLGLRHFPLAYLFAVILLFILGFLICGRAEKVFGQKDSPRIVIDEIASMCLVYLFVKPSWPILVLGFILFRVFDVIKLPPGRKAEKLAGSAGVMLDDVVAAIYTVVVLFLIYIIVPEGIL